MAPVGELAEALLESASVVSADPVVSGARWEHLCIFFCLTALSQFAWIMYSATPTISRSAFDATASQANTWIKANILAGIEYQAKVYPETLRAGTTTQDISDTLDLIVAEDEYALASAFGAEIVRRADAVFRAREKTPDAKQRMRAAVPFTSLAHTVARNDQMLKNKS